jgi:hypothetical protein
LVGEPRVAEYADFLADRNNVERLIAHLEQGGPVPDRAPEDRS